MILCDRAIAAALERGAIRIDPYPAPECWSSTALDLTLDGFVTRWKRDPAAGLQTIFPASLDFNYKSIAAEHTETLDISAGGHDLKPQEFVLGWTTERIQLPHRSRLAARVEGKSSLARLGLGVHVTAPTIHAGFGFDQMDPAKVGNQIQLEIFNLGSFAIHLEKGMRICQLIFEEVHGTPQKGYAGMFADQGSQRA
jgi:dCTP deaminase